VYGGVTAYKVFICHAYGHRDVYSDLVKKLNNARRFDWRNLSVQYDMRFGTADEEVDNDELREEISEKIRECEVFLVLTYPVASRRRWLQWEILYAKELGKPIIGIARRLNDNVSSFVKRHAIDIVDTWREDHIVNAIKGYASEYRTNALATRRCNAAALPQEQPDTEVDAQPSPPAPNESGAGQTIAETPRDVLSRDHLGTYVPGALSSFSGKQPRWWWPFTRE
jgi:MTH538 TIR-like domain (DUF1863)